MVSSAIISACGKYRYLLSRSWAEGPRLLFIMLNPSTADATVDDPTIRLCCGWAKLLGFPGVDVVNLFAWRATNPKELLVQLKAGQNIVGPKNDNGLYSTARQAPMVICAWGNGGSLRGRAADVLSMLRQASIPVHCLKLSKSGQPVHPLYQPYTLVPQLINEVIGL